MAGVAVCRNCGASIVWLTTRNKKNVAVDPESLRDGEDPEDTIYNPQVHMCHWNSCDAQQKTDEPKQEEPAGWPDARDNDGEVPF